MKPETLPVPQRTGARWWESLDKAAKCAALEAYLNAGKSNAFVSELFKISSGSVARIRHVRNKRLYPERYKADGTPIAKKKSAELKLPKKPTSKVAAAKSKPPAKPKPAAKKEKPTPAVSNVVRLPRRVPPEHMVPADDSAVESRTPAEHPPGTSPALNRISALQEPRGGKDSPFPLTREQTKNPDDPTEAEIRAIEKAGYGDK